MEWVSSNGRGTLHTYTVMHHIYETSFREPRSYNIAVVKLDEGPYFHTNIVDASAEQLEVGMRVEVVFRSVSPDFTLPEFRPCER